MDDNENQTDGLRERKRRETRLRIAEVGLHLFDVNGYDATTLESVATASGVSPRTLFHYFRTKDEILHFWLGEDFPGAVGKALRTESVAQRPLAAIHHCLRRLIPSFEDERSLTVDRILNSTEALRVRKQAFFIAVEQHLCAALCDLWPEPGERDRLRTTAMMATGALRLALEERRREGGQRHLIDYLDDQMANVRLSV